MLSRKPHGLVKQVLERLYTLGWEVEEVIDVTGWWAQNIWKLTSKKQNFGMKLFITPLTDRLSETHNSKDIECIRATSEAPCDFYDVSSVISDCYTSARGFEKRLDVFVSEINTFRNSP